MREMHWPVSMLQRDPIRPLMLVFCVVVTIFSFGCKWLKARDEMNKGVEAYKNDHFTDAVQHFKQALLYDPENNEARLQLASSYLVQWTPGEESPANRRNYEAAKETFQEVLRKDPRNKVALASLASMAYQSALNAPPDHKQTALEEARKWNLKRIEVNPKDAEAYYYLGVIAWNETYFPIQDIRLRLKMTKTQPGPLRDADARNEARQKYGKKVADGIAALHTAIDLNKNYDDAMSYLSLLLRVNADLEDSQDAARQDIEQADYWADKGLKMRRMKAVQPQKPEASRIFNLEYVLTAVNMPELIESQKAELHR